MVVLRDSNFIRINNKDNHILTLLNIEFLSLNLQAYKITKYN